MFLSSTFVSLQNTTWNKAYPWFLEKKVLVLLTILRDDYYFNLQPSLLLSHTIENSHKACSQKISPPLGELHSSIYLWNTTSKVAGCWLKFQVRQHKVGTFPPANFTGSQHLASTLEISLNLVSFSHNLTQIPPKG